MAQDDLARLGLEVDSRGVATARGRLQAFRVAGGRAEKQANRFVRTTDRLNTKMTRLSATVRLLAGGFAALLGISAVTRVLANFAQEMATVSAITNASASEFKALREEAKRLGITTRFSASQAASGMTFLARAGFTVTQVLTSINDVLLLAQAGALDLASAADIASNILKGFRLEAEETARVVDVLAQTASSSNTNIIQLGAAMSFLAPAAAAVGVEVELAAAAVGVLSDAGIQATRAGTGMRQIFIQLLNPTGKARAELEDLGLAVEDINIESRGLIPVLQTLRDAQIGLSESANLVGARQSASLLVLTQSIERLEQLEAANKAAEGRARAMARVMDDNLQGALFAVKSAVEGLIIAFGDLGVESRLTQSFRGMAAALRAIAGELPAILVGAKAAGIALAGAFSARLVLRMFAAARGAIALQLALGAATVTTATFGAAMVAAQRAVRALTLAISRNPIGLLAVGIAAAATGLVIYNSRTDQAAIATKKFRDAVLEANVALEKANTLSGQAANLARDEAIARLQAARAVVAGTFSKEALAIIEEQEHILQTFPNLLGDIGGDLSKIDFSEVARGGRALAAKAIEGLQELRNETAVTAEEITAFDQAILVIRSDLAGAEVSARATADAVADLDTELAAAALSAEALEKIKSSFNGLLDVLDPVAAAMRDYTSAQELLIAAEQAGVITHERSVELFGKLRAATNAARFPIEAMELALEEERLQATMTNDEREIHVRLLQLENRARAIGLPLSDKVIENFERELKAIRSLRRARQADEQASTAKVNRAIAESDRQSDAAQNRAREVGQSFKSSFGAALSDINNVTGALEALNDKLLDIAANAVFDQIFGTFGGGNAGGGFGFGDVLSFFGIGGSGANVAYDTTALLIHGGGVVGDPQIPRFHSGRRPELRANEQLAVLENDEEVLTGDDPRNVRNLSHRRNRTDGLTVVFNMPPGTDPNAMRRSAGQISSRVQRSIRAGAMRVD